VVRLKGATEIITGGKEPSFIFYREAMKAAEKRGRFFREGTY